MVRKISNSVYGAAGKVESLLLPARRKIRGRSAEDLRKIPEEDMSRGAHGQANASQLAPPSLTGQSTPNRDEQSAEDLRRTPRRIRVAKVALFAKERAIPYLCFSHWLCRSASVLFLGIPQLGFASARRVHQIHRRDVPVIELMPLRMICEFAFAWLPPSTPPTMGIPGLPGFRSSREQS